MSVIMPLWKEMTVISEIYMPNLMRHRSILHAADVSLVAVHLDGKPKVRDLGNKAPGFGTTALDQDVLCLQIRVYNVEAVEVHHAFGNVCSRLQDFLVIDAWTK